MNLFNVESWVKAPADRDVIARWTVGGEDATHAVALPVPPDPAHFTFLAFGDTGNADAAGPYLSPQEAVANEMTAEAALPESGGAARFVVHMGDVVYMTGEHRLYDRNFRRPYTPFLTPESTVDNLVFRLPFLPVPGNHDYYDIGSWMKYLARVPILGAGLRAVTHRLFAFSMPEGGSDMGRAYMQAFVDLHADSRPGPVPYTPGERTRLPNRYYRFRMGDADFFALDSNTLDAPPPWTDKGQIRADALQRIEKLESEARSLDTQLRHEQRTLDQWCDQQRRQVVDDPGRVAGVRTTGRAVLEAARALKSALERVQTQAEGSGVALGGARTIERHWSEAVDDLADADDPRAALVALKDMESASDDSCAVLSEVEECLGSLPEGPVRTATLEAVNALERRLDEWSDRMARPPQDLCDRLQKLSEDALDVQRELALERRRAKYRPDDYDSEQVRWLNAALTESVRERPDGWRIVYLHHPLYTTVSNHCERPDVQAVRDNLLSVLAGRVHLILSGHSHAFEWFRSSALPYAGLFVTGGGGQVTLRRSVIAPRLLGRHRDRYAALREAGIQECAVAGRGPVGAGGVDGRLYHYLRVEVTPDALIVHPVGVRHAAGGFRREEPMPVFHAASLPEDDVRPRVRGLTAIEIRRNAEPRAVWESRV